MFVGPLNMKDLEGLCNTCSYFEKWKLDCNKCPELCLVNFLAYIRLMKHYVPDMLHITGLSSTKGGFVPAPIIGSVQGQDRSKHMNYNSYFPGPCITTVL